MHLITSMTCNILEIVHFIYPQDNVFFVLYRGHASRVSIFFPILYSGCFLVIFEISTRGQ